jgi:hypothetical protein
MADKATALSIIIRTVDQSTAKIQAINARLAVLTKPIQDSNKAFGELRDHLGLLGLDAVKNGFSRVGKEVTDLIGKVAMVGGAVAGMVGVAVTGLLSLVDHFDQLGDTAERLGTVPDFLAAFRYSAERAGAPIEGVDEALQSLVTNMGAAKSGAGKMLKFLEEHVGHVFAQQVVHANSLEEALGLIADAAAKLPDAARRSKLVAATLGNAALAPLLARGPKGVQELLTDFHDLAGNMGEAAEAAGVTDDALKRMHAATEGVKAGLVTGLSPALTVIIGQMTEWLAGHRAEVEQWASDIGKKLPGAVDEIVKSIKGAVSWVQGFIKDIGGWKVAVELVAAAMLGPLVASFAALSVALVATPFGAVLLAMTPIVAAIAAIVSKTEAFERIARRLGFLKEKTPEQDFQERQDAMMEDGRRAAKAEAAAREALDNNPAVQQARLLQDQRDALLAIPTTADPKLAFLREGAAHQARMDALRAQIAQQAAAHPGPQDANIKIHITGDTKGVRATIQQGSTANVDLSVGPQMMGYGT